MKPSQTHHFSTPQLTLYLALTFLGIFYILSLTSAIVSSRKTPENTRFAFFLTPFDRFRTLDYLRSVSQPKSTNQNLLQFINILHHNDPEVLASLAHQYNNQGKSLEETQLYRLSIQLEKSNLDYQRAYIFALLESGETELVGKSLYSFLYLISPKEIQWKLSSEDFTLPIITPFYTKMLFESLFNAKNYAPYEIAKLVYKLGLDVLNKDPHLSKRFWELARDSAPGWSYFHVELASLEREVLSDEQAAWQSLNFCLIFADAKRHCQDILKTMQIPHVGSFQKNIDAIPLVLN